MTKYRSKKASVDGITFDSKAEATRYQALRLLQRAGEIDGLAIQPRFPFCLNSKKLFDYVADFSYQQGEQFIVEDVKGMDTRLSRLKRKIIMADRGIEIRLVDQHGNRKRTPTGRIKK